MNIGDYDQQIDDLLDAMSVDPDVTAEELRDSFLDFSFRCQQAAFAVGGAPGRSFVYDPQEDRSWGPFEDDDAANTFIEADKYLASWAVVRSAPAHRNYAPGEYK